MGSIEQKAASSAATGTGTGSAQTRTQERVPPPVVLTPWDPTDEGQFGRMYEQRVACTWGYDEVEEWKERMLGGQKVLYWIVSLPPGQHSSSISFLLFFSRSLSLCRSRSRCCSPDCCRCRGHHFLLSSLAFDVSRSEASSGGHGSRRQRRAECRSVVGEKFEGRVAELKASWKGVTGRLTVMYSRLQTTSPRGTS